MSVPQLVQLAISTVAIPGPRNPLRPDQVSIQLVNTIMGVDREGRAWQFDGEQSAWVQLPMMFKFASGEPRIQEGK